MMLYFLFIVPCSRKYIFNMHVKCFLGRWSVSFQWRAHWWYRIELPFPPEVEDCLLFSVLLSHWRTENFLFFPRNGLSDSVTTCSVPQEIREDRDRVRLDSMLLLIMKLDQLDQDIENALSTSSSPSSTPTNLRRQVPVSFPLPTSLHVNVMSLLCIVPLANETCWMAPLPTWDPDSVP